MKGQRDSTLRVGGKMPPTCRHCNKPMSFVTEAVSYYLFACENKNCIGWHNAVEVPKTKLAEKLAGKSRKNDERTL